MVEYNKGMKIGFGYDRLLGATKLVPAVVGSTSAIKGAAGQQVTADCIIVQEVESLHKQLGIAIDAGGSYMGFSASAKVDYLNVCDLSTYSTYVVVRVSVQNAFESFDEPKFHEDAEQLLKNSNTDRFHERFGDSFIVGLQTGGEYFGIYQISGTDQSERESLAVQVHAAYSAGPLASASLNTTINSATESSKSNLEVHVHVFRQGAVTTADLSLEDIMTTARRFPVDVYGGNSFAYAVLLGDYKDLRSPNDAFNYYKIRTQQDVLADLARKRFEFLALRDDIKYILHHSDDFVNSDGTDVDRDALSRQFDDVVAELNTMEDQASDCASDPSKCHFSTFDTSKFKLPMLRKKRAGIPVISLVGLRVRAITNTLNDTLREYADFKAAVLAEYGESRGILPTEEQYRFMVSGVRFTYDKKPTATWFAWIASQEPASGDIGSDTEVLLKVNYGMQPH